MELTASGKSLLGRTRGKWAYVSLAGAGRIFVPLPEPLQAIGAPEFSPDGRRLACRSPEAGAGEVYVVDFSEFTNLRQISRGGGFNPQWHPDSTELFFLSNDGRSLMAARPKPGGSEFEPPSRIFDLPASISSGHPGWPSFYSVSPDGNCFLMVENVEDNSTAIAASKPNAMIVENWAEEFRETK